MFRRLASLGQSDPSVHTQVKRQMTPPPEIPPSPETSSARPAGGLVGVFRGLTGARLQTNRSQPSSASSAPPTTVSTPVSLTRPLNLPPSPSLPTRPATTMRGLKDSHQALLENLRSGSPAQRITAANGLRFMLRECQIELVMEIWRAGKDMIEPLQSPDIRAAGWELLTGCVSYREAEGMHRHEFFEGISREANPDDFHLQLAALNDLSKGGRDLSGFDYSLFPLVVRLLSKAFKAASAARPVRQTSKTTLTGLDHNLGNVFEFLLALIRYSFSYADDKVVCSIIDTLVEICVQTFSLDDLEKSISVIKAILTYGAIPAERLGPCVKVLGSIFCKVSSLKTEAWDTIELLLQSHNGQAVTRHFLDVLRGFPIDSPIGKDATREVKGSLAVILQILSMPSADRLPPLPFSVLADGLEITARAVRATEFPKDSLVPVQLYTAIMGVINCLFSDSEGNVHPIARNEDWSMVLRAATECAKQPVNPNAAPIVVTINEPLPPTTNLDRNIDKLNSMLKTLLLRLEALASVKKSVEFIPRQTIIKFFARVHHILPDSGARIILEYFNEFRCCSPSDSEWEENITLVLESFFMDRTRSSEIRLMALRTITEANDMNGLITDEAAANFMPKMTRRILSTVVNEIEIDVLDAVMNLMMSIAATASMGLFNEIIQGLGDVFDNAAIAAEVYAKMAGAVGDKPKSAEGRVSSTSNVIIRGYVDLFLKLLDSDGAKCVKLFEILVDFAGNSDREPDARLTAMKLLFSLRADFANRIFVTHDLDCEYLASVLCRTKESQKAQKEKSMESANNKRQPPARLMRGVSFSGKDVHDRATPAGTTAPAPSPFDFHLWSYPDPEALTESRISRVLVSHIQGMDLVLVPDDNISDDEADNETEVEIEIDNNFVEAVAGKAGDNNAEAVDITVEDASTDGTDDSPKRLSMERWMEVVIDFIESREQNDSELYSFVLVHLPSQLTNHSLLCDSIDQIRKLRKILCSEILQGPNRARHMSIRTADVAICMYQSLTMVLSYHDYFSKVEEDEIVSAFIHGIGSWEGCAKPCIHALSICCYEIPQSTVRCINHMLPLMAKSITQPHVAMHILEFLCVLGRLPNIYINFREQDYNVVFGICFRYLQYVRDKRRTNSRSGAANDLYGRPSVTAASPEMASADDLPQYVYALAYHAITFWFLALKLPDRSRYVTWIAQNLFKDADGPNGPEEQAIVTMDFMQRMAYADLDESPVDPSFTAEKFGEIQKSNWLVGNSIVTIEQAVNTGWAQITKRQPTGTNAYVIRHPFTPPPAHQAMSAGDSQTKIMPAHFLLQFFATLPQPYESQWPVLVPDNDVSARAMASFDRNLSIDGHKIGVVYMGENQTDEREILANVSGSGDYVTFVNGLGTPTRLRGATFNTQGLDRRYDSDGKFAFCWRDRVTEIVYHVTTQMPTDLEADPHLINKKRHIGNDFVNIFWNDSGLPFNFNTIPSQFNYVNIVITPESRSSFVARREQTADNGEGAASDREAAPATNAPRSAHRMPFFRVKVMSKPGFPEISPAAETKMVSLRALPAFIRLLAMNASVFSLVWAHREAGEHVSSGGGNGAGEYGVEFS
ncbi:hypothetical protein TD95_003232 [Thielaviopsis punctulata]|uniref:Rap-GAP domain-containing protein n=1 Tax=Thielaviopsis punctulata TaxID=72032 RepID=A0A0F4ZCA5_9PEZI|nr:hypothetical protein TD95_003232 [Thielaviopsis punctulata]